jgi:sn-glycerol 3-phosphate transport system permease protein
MVQETTSLPTSRQPQVPLWARIGLTGVQWRETRKVLTALLYLAPSLILFMTFIFIPLVRSIELSLYLTDPIGRPAAFVWFLHYERLFTQDSFLNSMARSSQYVAITVPLVLLFSLALAMLGNLRLKKIAIFRVIYSITIAVSGATASIMFMSIYHPTLGTANYFLELLGFKAVNWLVSDATAIYSVAMVTVWLQVGLNTVILLAAMQGIPEELYESAMIDGASSWNKFRYITLPFLSSTFFFLLVVDMLAAFQTFTPVSVMTAGGPMDSTNILVYSIYREFYINGKYGFAAAQSIMLFLVMLVLTIFQFVFVERKVFYE